MRPPLGFPIFEGYERVEIATAAILAIYISLIILQVILEFKRNK